MSFSSLNHLVRSHIAASESQHPHSWAGVKGTCHQEVPQRTAPRVVPCAPFVGSLDWSPRVSGVDAESQQLVGVLVVEGAQVRQTQQQLREEGAVVWAAAGDEGAQGFDQTVLEQLYGSYISYARAI